MSRASLRLLFARFAIWQPRPHVADSWSGESLSWWFYRLTPGAECLYERTLIGSLWSSAWWALIKSL